MIEIAIAPRTAFRSVTVATEQDAAQLVASLSPDLVAHVVEAPAIKAKTPRKKRAAKVAPPPAKPIVEEVRALEPSAPLDAVGPVCPVAPAHKGTRRLYGYCKAHFADLPAANVEALKATAAKRRGKKAEVPPADFWAPPNGTA